MYTIWILLVKKIPMYLNYHEDFENRPNGMEDHAIFLLATSEIFVQSI
jgi:hypothetical protein